MTNEQINDSAIAIVLKERRLLSPGDTATHPSDPNTYEFYRYENGNAIIGFNGAIKSFPAREVFDPNILKKVALEIQANLLLPSKN